MNPDSPKTPQEEMEARLVALLLGELSDQEAAAWRAAIATNPELAKLHDRLNKTISLVRDATAKVTEPVSEQAAPLKLSEERREKLLAHFKTVKPKEFAPAKQQPKFTLAELAAVLAIIGVVSGISITWINSSRRESGAVRMGTDLQTATLVADTALDRTRAELLEHTLSVPGPGSNSVYSLNVVGYVNKPLESTEPYAANPLSPLPAAQPPVSALFDSTVSPTRKPTPSQEKRGPTSPTTATGRPGIVLPSADDSVSAGKVTTLTASLRGFYDDDKKAGAVSSPGQIGDAEWTGVLARSESARSSTNQFLGRYAYSAPPARTEGGEHFYFDLNRNAVVDATTGLPAATPESGFANSFAETQLKLADPQATTASGRQIDEGRVQISSQLNDFYSDLNRTPPATPPPTAGAAIAMNGVEQPTVVGRGISPITGLPVDGFAGDGAALGQTLTGVTRADPAANSYGLGFEPANRESGARGGAAGGGGTGGAGTSGGAESLLAQTELGGSRGRRGYAGAGGIPAGPQNAPGQIAAGDVVAGFGVTPTPALPTITVTVNDGQAQNNKPAKPQESLPDTAAVAELDADKAPVLGESPTLGKLFRSDSSALANRGSAPSVNETTPRQDQPGQQAKEILAYENLGTMAPPVSTSAGVPVASTRVRRFKSAQTDASGLPTDAGVAWTEESLRRKSSSIVLPSVESNGRIPSDKAAERLALVRKDKVEAATQVQDGRILLEAGKLADAEVKLNEAIKADPENREAFYNLSLAKERRYAQAEGKRQQDSKAGGKEVKQTYEKPLQLAQGRTESLKDQIAVLEPEVRAAQKKVDELGEKLAISDLDAAVTAPAPMLEAEKVHQLHAQLNNAEALLNREEVDAKALGQPVSEQRRGALQAEVDKLKEKAEQARTDDLAKAESSRPYYEAKQNLEEQLRRRSVDLALPKSAQVEIVDRAEPATEKTGFWRNLGAAIGGTYQSAARVKVEPAQSDIQGFTERSPFGAAYDPHFIQTEVEAIQSEAVLAKVVEKLNLNEGWAEKPGNEKLKKDETVAFLKKRLDLKPVTNTSLVEIRAKSDKPDEAAAIANAVAEAYTDYRLEKGRKLTRGGIEALKQQSEEQEEKVAQAQSELARVSRQSNVEIADLSVRKPSTNAPIPQPEIQTSENNFSTFSLNVSDVSFKLAAASLEQGQMPDHASIRSEEFINAFDYRDPEPLPGVPVAFAWERARYPFAHNRDLLRFSLKTAAAGRQAGRPLNIVLLLDNSGSMERADRVSIIREALHVLAGQLQRQDKISVITFARTPRLWVDGAPGSDAGAVAMAASEITPQGGTNLEEAMNLAYQTALRHYLAGGINRVVMLTDGAANLGNVEPESLKQKVEAHRKQGIALDCFGIGWEGYNDDLLEVLSRNGDGRYGFINSPEEAATEFAGQLAGSLQVAASDVKVQVEFNPARVTSYRQIGYAKHQLTKEQFRDNTVDAAEIAAQEAGNALYTAEVNPAGEGPLAIVRVRFKIPGTSDYREHEWPVPYTGGAVSLEQASPAMRLAASASAFSEWLVASPFASEVTPDALLGYLGGVPEIYGADARPKRLEWMIRQAKSIEGK